MAIVRRRLSLATVTCLPALVCAAALAGGCAVAVGTAPTHATADGAPDQAPPAPPPDASAPLGPPEPATEGYHCGTAMVPTAEGYLAVSCVERPASHTFLTIRYLDPEGRQLREVSAGTYRRSAIYRNASLYLAPGALVVAGDRVGVVVQARDRDPMVPDAVTILMIFDAAGRSVNAVDFYGDAPYDGAIPGPAAVGWRTVPPAVAARADGGFTVLDVAATGQLRRTELTATGRVLATTPLGLTVPTAPVAGDAAYPQEYYSWRSSLDTGGASLAVDGAFYVAYREPAAGGGQRLQVRRIEGAAVTDLAGPEGIALPGRISPRCLAPSGAGRVDVLTAVTEARLSADGTGAIDAESLQLFTLPGGATPPRPSRVVPADGARLRAASCAGQGSVLWMYRDTPPEAPQLHRTGGPPVAWETCVVPYGFRAASAPAMLDLFIPVVAADRRPLLLSDAALDLGRTRIQSFSVTDCAP